VTVRGSIGGSGGGSGLLDVSSEYDRVIVGFSGVGSVFSAVVASGTVGDEPVPTASVAGV
jgi:hypothetical protein